MCTRMTQKCETKYEKVCQSVPIRVSYYYFYRGIAAVPLLSFNQLPPRPGLLCVPLCRVAVTSLTITNDSN